ncbi:MAG: hypothetical protein GX442_09820 [Candidatus Riflebacteria bacterium]|nr:hypothetical protein [Candidatus Riflebacteria bacterium]
MTATDQGPGRSLPPPPAGPLPSGEPVDGPGLPPPPTGPLPPGEPVALPESVSPANVGDHARTRMLPYGLARAFGAAGPYLMQAAMWHWAGAAPAGRFFLLASAAMFLVLLADLGAGNAFPLLWGSRPGRAVPELADVLTMRQGVAVAGVVALGGAAAAGLWRQMSLTEALLIGVFVCSRTALTARQGRLYAFQRFDLLVRAAACHAGGLLAGLGVAMGALGMTPTACLLALIAGNVAELVAMAAWGAGSLGDDLPPPRAVSWSERLRLAWRRLAPFAVAGVAAAVYVRSDAFIGDLFLEPEALGRFGTIDALYRLAIAPVYLSGQAVYPAINAAHEEGRPAALRLGVWHHLLTGGILAAVGMGVFAALTVGQPATGPGSPFWWPFFLAIPVAVPAALVAPLCYSRRQERAMATLAVTTGLARPLGAWLLVASLGPAGLAVNHLALDAGQTFIALAVFPWLGAARWAAGPPPSQASQPSPDQAPRSPPPGAS